MDIYIYVFMYIWIYVCIYTVYIIYTYMYILHVCKEKGFCGSRSDPDDLVSLVVINRFSAGLIKSGLVKSALVTSALVKSGAAPHLSSALYSRFLYWFFGGFNALVVFKRTCCRGSMRF